MPYTINRLDQSQAINELKCLFPQYDFSKTVYTRSKDKIKVICPEHGEFEVIYNNMKTKGRGCPKCRGGSSYTQEDAVNKLKTLFPNYDYSEFVYNGYKEKCTLICANGHKVIKSFNSFSEGYGCNECKDKVILDRNKLSKKTYGTIKENVKSIEEKYPTLKIQEIPVNKKNKIKIICSDHGEFTSTIYDINKSGLNPCKVCRKHSSIDKADYIFTNGSSKEEAIREYIKNTFGLLAGKNKSIIPSKLNSNYCLEIDMYIPELKLGFEFNGTYWHSEYGMKERKKNFKELYGNSKGFDQYKYEYCKSHGIDLYFIKEEEFDKNSSKVLQNIKNIIIEKQQNLNK